MDLALREYRRRMASGEGSMRQYLHMLARGGHSIRDSLCEHHKAMVLKHLSKDSSADLSPFGYQNKIPVIETIRFLVEIGDIRRSLIVCPAAYLPIWERYFEEASAGLDVVILRGRRRDKKRALAGPGHVFITSYPSLVGLKDSVLESSWDLMVADEVHYIRNPQAQRSQLCYLLADRVKMRIALGGCAFSSIVCIFGVFRFIDHRLFGKSSYEFMQTYFDRVQKRSANGHRYPQWDPKPDALSRIRNIISNYLPEVSDG